MSEKKIMRRPDVDVIKQLLEETLKDLPGVRFWPHGDAYYLTVDICGSASRGPVLDLDDLERIAEALLRCRTEWRRRLDILFYPTERSDDGRQALSFQIETELLKEDLLVEFETKSGL